MGILETDASKTTGLGSLAVCFFPQTEELVPLTEPITTAAAFLSSGLLCIWWGDRHGFHLKADRHLYLSLLVISCCTCSAYSLDF